jgi:dimethylamine--corrinoid protein Co-methyltransferase
MPNDIAIPTRMGDGSLAEMTPAELRVDVEEATRLAARKAKVEPLSPDELGHVLDIYASAARFAAVDIGDEVMLSSDGGGSRFVGTPVLDMIECEQRLGHDCVELWHIEYSYKAVKTLLAYEQQQMQHALLQTIAPAQYGAQPNLGFYTQPDGPAPNWFELLPQGRIAEARAAVELAVDTAVRDFVYVAEGMLEVGADGVNFDTTGSAGDADFLAALLAVERLRERYPERGIELGMAAEMVMGVHGELEYKGRRLAGMWPAQQLEVATLAGAHVFGPTVNVNSGKSCAWNTAYALTLIKPATVAATIPVHVNAGQGVCGVPLNGYPGADAVSRMAKCFVEILRVDGL